MSNQPDFTQMTKEEVIAYFTSKMADEASNKAAEENRSGQVILSLKQQLSQTEQKLEIANADNKKLTDYKINSESLIKNILDSIKENSQIYSRFIHDDFTPLNDIYNFKELNMYVEDILSTLFSAVSADMRHMDLKRIKDCHLYPTIQLMTGHRQMQMLRVKISLQRQR